MEASIKIIDTYSPLKHFRHLSEEAVQFTDTDKNRIFNEIKGNRSAGFDDGGKPVLFIFNSNEPGDFVTTKLGDFIVYNYETKRYTVELEKEYCSANIE